VATHPSSWLCCGVELMTAGPAAHGSPAEDPTQHTGLSLSIYCHCQHNYLFTYDLYSPVHNVLYVGPGMFWGLGPGIRKFLGPVKWHRVDKRVPFGAQKNPSCINHRCIGSFMHKKPTREVSGPILCEVEEQVNIGT
jgi:hypothetical protein